MNSFIQHVVTGSLFAGLEVEFLSEGIALHLVVLKRKGKKVVADKFISVGKIEELSAHLSKDIPVAIAFTGKGLLHRRVAADPASDSKTLLSKILTNASTKDFYVQTVAAINDEQFVSVIRKSAVEILLEELKKNNLSAVECSLGPLAIVTILELIGKSEDKICFGHHELLFQDNVVDEVQYNENNSGENVFDLSGQAVESNFLLAFSVAFNQILNGQKAGILVDEVVQSKSNFLDRKLFKAGGVTLLFATLFLLLLNYFAFSHYWSMKNELESKLQTDGGAFEQVRGLEAQVKTKRQFLSQAGFLNSSNHSYYADQLAAELPDEIRLTKMELAPRIKLSDEDSIGFTAGKIEIEGSCSESVSLNKWLQHLKEKNWIKNAILESYLQDKSMTQGEFSVALEIE